jgi:hypothetical protein
LQAIATEVCDGEVRQIGIEESRIGDAPEKEGHAQERIGPEGQEPQAGDRYGVKRGAQEGREGTSAEGVAEDLAQGREQEEVAGPNAAAIRKKPVAADHERLTVRGG